MWHIYIQGQDSSAMHLTFWDKETLSQFCTFLAPDVKYHVVYEEMEEQNGY